MPHANPRPRLVPYIIVKDAAEAIAFYTQAFGAEEAYRLVDPGDGRIGHAELRFGDAMVMLADEYPDFGAISPDTLGGSPVRLHIYVDDVDAAFARALTHGATELRPVKDQFWGDRSGMLIDPFGHTWTLTTTTEEVAPEAMQQRWDEALAG